MKKLLATVFAFLLKKMNLYSIYNLRKSSYLRDIGWFKSFQLERPVDNNGNPLPWMTYSAIHFFEKRINKDMTVFEYGCGNSTLWWAKRVKNIVSCEHDKAWYDTMNNKISQNVELHQVDLEYGGSYCGKVSDYSMTFDVVIIDGRDRVNCAKNCLNALTDRGVIIWDDSDRAIYQEGFNYLQEKGYKRIDFEGMGPALTFSWCTSIFYKEDNCLHI